MDSTPDPSLLIAEAHLAARRMPEAEAVLRASLKRNPHSAVAFTYLGQALRAQKRIDEAIAAFQRAVEIEPQSPGAYANLGNTLYAAGRVDAAIDSYRRAIQLQPDFADVCNNLAAALRSAGRLDEAIAHFKQAATMRPGFAMPLTNLGAVLYSCGRYEEAADAYRQSLAIADADAEVHNLLGNTLLNLQKPAEAMVYFERAMALRPDFAEPWNNRANALRMLGRLEESIEAYRRAIAVRPDFPEPYCNLSTPLMMLGRADEAMAALRRAIALRPTLVEAHCKLGAALLLQDDPDSAAAAGEQALRIQPEYASAHNLLGDAWKERGRIDLAIEEFRKAVDLEPSFVTAHDSLVYSILFDPAYDPPRILAEHAKWNRQHALRHHDSWRPFKNDHDPDRRLRVGYVSPDFRDHVIGRNILPVLSRHDSTAIEVFCYSSVIQPDAATEQFRRASSVFREVTYLGDDACAEVIRSDQIDILVDLTLHLLGNRLGVFARKPAPVQVTWAGYPGTTGLGAIDYRLTDPYLDPPGEHDGHYSEQSWRLRDTFWCYDPLGSQTPVNDLPAGRNGYITFGCLNNPCKINQFTLKLWARAMRDVPGSKLILAAQSGSARRWLAEMLQREGIAPDRVAFESRLPRPRYMERFNSIDIALDTYPYNGHTTGLDGLWMGVPTISLYGQSVVSRAGLSQLTNLGLADLATATECEFAMRVRELAADRVRLAELRCTLRDRMAASPLMDAAALTRQIESAYRHFWRRWCGTEAASPPAVTTNRWP